MFENLSERIDRAFKVLKGEGRITEINVAETLKEVRASALAVQAGKTLFLEKEKALASADAFHLAVVGI